ncbi:MAG: ATP-binding protein [Gammaproteobacteria bacterium]|nr:ATP-binding protein [Gammaproteobacteria bacterium]
MTSLNLKITLAFIIVSLVGVLLVGILVQQVTRSAFDRFLFDQDKSAILSLLTQHYEDEGSWQNLENAYRQYVGSRIRNPASPRFDSFKGVNALFQIPYTLVDTDGKVVFGRPLRTEQPVSTVEIQKGIPLEVDGHTVGWLLEPHSPFQWERNTPQATFLMTLNRVVLLSAAGALVIALVLGGILARSLTRPLRELSTATQAVAQGELGYQVEVRSKDEIGQLAGSFNQMSADLARANQLRKQTTADIAHDLRTPISVIMGYTEALNDGKLSGSPEVYTTMHQVSEHLSHLIDDLRTLSLADAGELPINLQNINPTQLLERTAAAYASQAQSREVALRVKADPDLPEIEVDPERMLQVMSNLVSNALRYTPSGGWIELSASAEQDDITIRVQDNGVGIAPEDLPKVFTRFYRGDKSRQQNGEAGLGLTIARSLVEMQGGKLSVESLIGLGTTFTIRFPCVAEA